MCEAFSGIPVGGQLNVALWRQRGAATFSAGQGYVLWQWGEILTATLEAVWMRDVGEGEWLTRCYREIHVRNET